MVCQVEATTLDILVMMHLVILQSLLILPMVTPTQPSLNMASQ